MSVHPEISASVHHETQRIAWTNATTQRQTAAATHWRASLELARAVCLVGNGQPNRRGYPNAKRRFGPTRGQRIPASGERPLRLFARCSWLALYCPTGAGPHPVAGCAATHAVAVRPTPQQRRANEDSLSAPTAARNFIGADRRRVFQRIVCRAARRGFFGEVCPAITFRYEVFFYARFL